jgi:hypothetical protein
MLALLALTAPAAAEAHAGGLLPVSQAALLTPLRPCLPAAGASSGDQGSGPAGGVGEVHQLPAQVGKRAGGRAGWGRGPQLLPVLLQPTAGTCQQAHACRELTDRLACQPFTATHGCTLHSPLVTSHAAAHDMQHLLLTCPYPHLPHLPTPMLLPLPNLPNLPLLPHPHCPCRSFVEDNPRMSWCTGGGCESAAESIVERGSDEALDVSCTCGTAFCFNCHEEAHRPVRGGLEEGAGLMDGGMEGWVSG